jgi:mRNA interferase RelE/StbE
MIYNVKYSPKARRQLQKMDNSISTRIVSWVRNNLSGCDNPRAQGKALTGNLSGKWRYRIGDYRIIADISDEQITILIAEVGHRNNIYKLLSNIR